MKILKRGEIYKYHEGTRVRIKDNVVCHQMYHDGGTLTFQDRDETDRDEYRVGIKVNIGSCHCFHPDDYELIK